MEVTLRMSLRSWDENQTHVHFCDIAFTHCYDNLLAVHKYIVATNHELQDNRRHSWISHDANERMQQSITPLEKCTFYFSFHALKRRSVAFRGMICDCLNMPQSATTPLRKKKKEIRKKEKEKRRAKEKVVPLPLAGFYNWCLIYTAYNNTSHRTNS